MNIWPDSPTLKEKIMNMNVNNSHSNHIHAHRHGNFTHVRDVSEKPASPDSGDIMDPAPNTGAGEKSAPRLGNVRLGGGGLGQSLSTIQSLLNELLQFIKLDQPEETEEDDTITDVKGAQPTKGAAASVRTSAASTPGNAPDAGKPPKGMPQELWNDCVDASKKTGVDAYVLAAQMERESQFGKALAGSPSAGDGVMQVEPGTRSAYAKKFEAKMGHPYNHGSQQDQVAMAAVILSDKGGSTTSMLQKYNGGDNWQPGARDSYGRVIKADEYAASVSSRAAQMRNGG
jgi:hypothetical protein